MTKKGLTTMVCVTAMSAMSAWAAYVTTYAVQTKTTNAGGSVQVRNNPALSGTGAIKYTNFTTTGQVAVTVTPDSLHKITALTKNGVAQTIADPNAPVTVYVQKQPAADPLRPTVLPTQSVVATFAVKSNTGVVLKTWQLQTKNANAGGTITTTRGNDPTKNLYTVGQLVLKNYTDTTPVDVVVAANTGYAVDKVTLNGAAVGSTFTVNPSLAGKVFTVQATYKKLTSAVTITNQYDLTKTPKTPINGEITPAVVAPVSYGGFVNLTVSPTGTNNIVTAITVDGQSDVVVEAKDNAGKTVAPFTGPVQVKISNIKAPLTVTAGYKKDTTGQMQSCTSSCHLNSSNAAVLAVPAQWNASAHKASAIDCVTCHSTMPGGVVKASVDANSFQITAASAGTVGANYCSACHAASVAKVQASTHYTMEASKLVCTNCHAAGHNPAPNAEACVGCHAVVNDHTAETMGNKSCIQCHDKHNPKIMTGALGQATAHPAVTLYTFEEVGMQMAGGQPVPVQVDANGKGMPYSPKQTCGTSGCHVKGGVDYTYDKISDHAFHSNEGRSEYQDSANGKFDATKNKPWLQSTAMVGKW